MCTHTLIRGAVAPWSHLGFLLCSLNNWSILKSIALQRPNECAACSPQRFGGCYLIYRLNEPLLDAHQHTRAHTVAANGRTAARAAAAVQFTGRLPALMRAPAALPPLAPPPPASFPPHAGMLFGSSPPPAAPLSAAVFAPCGSTSASWS